MEISIYCEIGYAGLRYIKQSVQRAASSLGFNKTRNMITVEWLTAALEEYNTLREESLASMKMQQLILAYGVAAIGVIITSALNSWNTSPLPEFFFLALFP